MTMLNNPALQHRDVTTNPQLATNTLRQQQDIEFAHTIGSSLLAEVRRLQGLLGERDQAIQEMKRERDEFENVLGGLRSALRAQELTADKYKEENWNLEVAMQDLRANFLDLQSNQASEQQAGQQTVRRLSTISQLHALSHIHPAFDELARLLESFEKLDVGPRLEVGEFRATGGYADVYDGWLMEKEDGITPELKTDDGHEHTTQSRTGERVRVAIKQFRVFRNADIEFAKEFVRELRLWANLNHPNVLPLLGFTLVDKSPSLVSEWMVNGTVLEYVRKRPEIGAAVMAEGIAEGLAFLHANSVIHADLKSDNVLVDRDGHPVLCDFGISRVVIESKTVTGTSSLKGNIRWMSVELLQPQVPEDAAKHQFHTRASDVWAYGMVVNELLSHQIPFHDIIHEAMVIMAIGTGQRPVKPTTCTDPHLERLWSICVSCWKSDPKERPIMAEVCAKVKALLIKEDNSDIEEQNEGGITISELDRYNLLLEDIRETTTTTEEEPLSMLTSILFLLLLRVPERYLYKLERVRGYGIVKARMRQAVIYEFADKWSQFAVFSSLITTLNISFIVSASSGYLDDRWVAKYLKDDSIVTLWTLSNIKGAAPYLRLTLISMSACILCTTLSIGLPLCQRSRSFREYQKSLFTKDDTNGRSLLPLAIIFSLPQTLLEWGIGLQLLAILGEYMFNQNGI